MKNNDIQAKHLIRQAKYDQRIEPVKRTFLIKLIATGFGSGYCPFASGTAGTLVAIPIYLGLWWGCNFLPFPLLSYLFLVFILMVGGFWICDQAEGIFRQKDSGFIVLDEIIGFFICMVALPPNLFFMAIGFFLFRLFDVWKPLYISKLQDLPGGLGVVIDDVACGILTCGILHGVQLVWF